MRQVKEIRIFSEKRTSILALNVDNNRSLSMFYEFISIFGTINQEKDHITVNPLQQNTEKIFNLVSSFVSKNKASSPQLNALQQYFDSLSIDEYFYILPNTDLASDKATEMQLFLKTINAQPDNLDAIKLKYESELQQHQELLGKVIDNYNIYAPINDKPFFIGVSDKNKRACRFCERSVNNGATFKSKAHAIPEALGNKHIILREECDDCNSKFGRTIERDLIILLSPFNNVFHVKGKKGTRKLKMKNGTTVENKDRKVVIVTKEASRNIGKAAPPFEIPLVFHEKIRMVNVYKALVKIALSVVGSEHLPKFKKTITWLTGLDPVQVQLPFVHSTVFNRGFDKNPQITIYTRKTNNYSLPFMVGEFRFCSLIYVFIVPFCSNDKLTFTEDVDYNVYWNTFIHYSKAGLDWKKNDFSFTNERDFEFTMKFEQSNNASQCWLWSFFSNIRRFFSKIFQE